MSRVAEIRARLEAATPGPWHIEESSSACKEWNDATGRYDSVPCYDVPEPVTMGDHECGHMGQADAAFIAHSPADISYLLSIAENAAALLEALRTTESTVSSFALESWSDGRKKPLTPGPKQHRVFAALKSLSAALGTEAGG